LRAAMRCGLILWSIVVTYALFYNKFDKRMCFVEKLDQYGIAERCYFFDYARDAEEADG